MDKHDLVIDELVFPQGWYVFVVPTTIPERAHRGERESLYVTLRPEGFDEGAQHEVYRYRNKTDAAIAFYLDFSRNEFPNLREAMITPWAVPEEWSFRSTVADRFKFSCAEINVLAPYRSCHVVAQYDEYISVFVTHVSPEYMMLRDLELVLAAIDERMAHYLRSETH